MVRNVGGTPRPFGDDKKKKISINDASTNGSVIKISSLQESLWKKQARQNAIDSSRQTQGYDRQFRFKPYKIIERV